MLYYGSNGDIGKVTQRCPRFEPFTGKIITWQYVCYHSNKRTPYYHYFKITCIQYTPSTLHPAKCKRVLSV